MRVFATEDNAATVILGRGLALRTEVAIEVALPHRGKGLAAELRTEARRLVGPGQVVFAQVAPGNAASVRAFLAARLSPDRQRGSLLR